MSASVYQPTLGSNLTDADATVSPASDEVSEYVLPAATLSANRILTLGIAGTPDFKFVVRIIRADLTNKTYTVKNDAGTTLYTFTASPTGAVGASFYYDGSHYAFLSTYEVSESAGGDSALTNVNVGVVDSPYAVPDGVDVLSCFPDDADVDITLPDPATNEGRQIFIKYTELDDPGDVVISVTGGGTIDGAATYTLSDVYDWVVVISNGIEWNVYASTPSGAAGAFIAAGVSGGQTATGGTAASENLTLSSTANGTKGKVIFGSTTGMQFSEVNNFITLGIATPASATFAHYKYTGASGANLYIENPSTGTAAYYGVTLGNTDALFGGQYFGFWQYGPSFTTSGNRTAGTAEFLLGGTSGANMLFNIGPATGDFIWGSNSVTEKMRLTNAGLLKVGNTGSLPAGAIAQFNRDTNAANYLVVSNPNTGTTAEAGVILSQSATSYTNYLYMAQLSTGFTTNGPFIANAAAFEHTSSGAHMFFSAYGTQDIDFYTTTSRTLRLKIATGGDVSLPSGNLLFSKAGDQNIDKSGSGDLLVIADNGGQSVRFVGNSGYSLVLGDTSVEMPSLGTPGGFVKAAPSSGALTSYALYTPKTGTALTNADQTIQPFTDKSSEYVQSAALTVSRTKTLGTTTVVTGTLVRIVRTDGAAFTMLVVNGGGGGGTLFTFAANATETQGATFYYNGSDWVLVGFEYLVS